MNFLLFVAFLFIKDIVSQNLTLCSNPRKKSICILTCEVPEFKSNISFQRNGTAFGSCIRLFGKLTCGAFNNRFSINQNESKYMIYLTIKHLDKEKDEGDWHCVYNNSQSAKKELVIYDKIYNSSDTIVTERKDLFHFPINCMIPKPTARLKCKGHYKNCTVDIVQNSTCQNSTLSMYNVTCKEAAECFHINTSTVAIKINGNIIENRTIKYQTKSTQKTEGNKQSASETISVLSILLFTTCILAALVFRY